MKNMILDIYRE